MANAPQNPSTENNVTAREAVIPDAIQATAQPTANHPVTGQTPAAKGQRKPRHTRHDEAERDSSPSTEDTNAEPDAQALAANPDAPVLLAQAASGAPVSDSAPATGNAWTGNETLAPAPSAQPTERNHTGEAVLPWLLSGGVAAWALQRDKAPNPTTPAQDNVVTGTLTAGDVVDGHGLKVEIYAADGTTKLGEDALDDKGRYTVNIGNYSGIVIARVVDQNDDEDYLDEATNEPKDLDANLMAVTIVPGGTVTLNINPLTAIAAQKAGLAADGSGALSNQATVVNANAAVAAAFGLTSITEVNAITTNGGNFKADDGLSNGEKLGAILGALSGADRTTEGGTQAVINTLVNAITVNGSTGTLSDGGRTLVLGGAAVTTPNVNDTFDQNVLNIIGGPTDTTRPTVTITASDSSLTVGETSTITFTLSEPSSSFTADDITVSGGTLSNFSSVSSSVYTATFTPTANSTTPASIGVAADSFTDAAGNTNTAATSLSLAVDTTVAPTDTTRPTVTISASNTSLTVGETSTITFTLSEPSSSFTADEITVSGGTLSNFTAVTSTVYTATFTPTANSTTPASIGVASDSFTDAAGNGNNASTSLGLTVDTVVPAAPTLRVQTEKVTLPQNDTVTVVKEGTTTTRFSNKAPSSPSDLSLRFEGDVADLGNNAQFFLPFFVGLTHAARGADGTDDFLVSETIFGEAKTFMVDGLAYQTIPVGTGDDRAHSFISSLAAQMKGVNYTYVAGESVGANGSKDFSVVRIVLTTGELDSEFSTDGKLIVAVGEGDDVAKNVIMLADGGALLSGTTKTPDGSTDAAVVKVLPNGNLDTTFGNQSKLVMSWGAQDDELVSAMELPDGGFVLLGTSGNADGTYAVVVTRLSSTGQLDSSWGNGTGSVRLMAQALSSHGRTIALDEEGRLMVAGYALVDGEADAVIWRINLADGTPDLTFYDQGWVMANVPGDQYPGYLSPQSSKGATFFWMFADSSSIDRDGNSSILRISFNPHSTDYSLTEIPLTNNQAGYTVFINENGDSSESFGRVYKQGDAAVALSPLLTLENSAMAGLASRIQVTIARSQGKVASDLFEFKQGSNWVFENGDVKKGGANGTVVALYQQADGELSLSFAPNTPDNLISEFLQQLAYKNTDILTGQTAVPIDITVDTNNGADASVVTRTVHVQVMASSSQIVRVEGLETQGHWEYSTDGGLNWQVGVGSRFVLGTVDPQNVRVRQIDSAGNVSAVSSLELPPVDTTRPTVTIAASDTSLTVGETANLTFTLSEPSSDFGASGVTVSGGTLSNFTAVSSTVYTATFTPTANSTTTASIGVDANRFTDAARNGNTAATTLSLAVDTSPPSVSISSDKSALKAGETATITFTFSHDPGDSLTKEEIIVTGGNLGTLQGTGLVRTASFTPLADLASGAASISISAGSYTNASGNAGSAATAPTIRIDTTLPAPLSLEPVDDTTVLPSGNLVLTFTEAIVADTGDVRLVNDSTGAVTTMAINSSAISIVGNTLTINPASDLVGGESYHIEIDNGAITDVAGNAWAGIQDASSWNFQAASPVVRLNTVAGDNQVNATENTDRISIGGVVSSNDSAVLAAFTAANFSVVLSPRGGGTSLPVTISSYNGSTGAWIGFVPDNTLLSDKTYDITVSLTGTTGAANGLEASTRGSISVDLGVPDAPAVDAVAGDNRINAQELSSLITGTAEVGSTVHITLGGHTRTALIDGTHWAYALTAEDITAMGDGTPTITVTQTDAAGNVSNSTTRTLSIDRVAPATATIDVVAGDNIVSASEAGTTITGTNEAGASVTLSFGNLSRSAEVSGTTWRYTLTAEDILAMGQGLETLRVTQTDAAGNESATSGTRNITISTIIPDAPVINIVAGNDRINASEVGSTITGSNAKGASVSLFFGGQTRSATMTGTTWAYALTEADITAMGQGSEDLSATQTVNGNTSATSVPRKLNIDTIAPTGLSFNPVAGDNTIGPDETNTTLSGSAERGATVRLNIGGNLVDAEVTGSNWTYTLTDYDLTLLGQGDKTLSATQTDAAGNTSAAVTQAITVRTETPKVTISSDKTALKADETATISFNFSEDPGSSFDTSDLTVVGGTLSNLTTTGTTRTATFTPLANQAGGQASISLAEGSYSNAAGTPGESGKAPGIVLDTLAPKLLNQLPQDGAMLLPSGNLMLTFSEAIAKGTGQISLIKDSDPLTPIILDMAAEVTVNGNTLTLNPANDLESGADYYVVIDDGAITDVAGNAYAGVTYESWLFSVTSPAISMGVIAQDNIVNSSENASGIVLSGVVSSNDPAVISQLGASHFTITLTPQNNAHPTVTVPSSALEYNTSNGVWFASVPANSLVDAQTYRVSVGISITLNGPALTANTSSSITTDFSLPDAPALNAVASDNVIDASETGVILSGTLSSGNTVSLSLGGITRTTIVDGSTWRYALTEADIKAMGQGSETIRVTQIDSAGNVSQATSQVITIDTVGPTGLTFDVVAGDSTVNASEAGTTLSGNNEAGATVVLSIGGNTRNATVSGTTWSYTLTDADITAMGQGAETLSVTQRDAAGNTSGAVSQSVTVATEVPTVAITSSASSLKAGQTATITFTFSQDPGEGFSSQFVTVSGGQLGEITGTGTVRTGTFTPDAGVSSGQAMIGMAAGSYLNAVGTPGSAAAMTPIAVDTVAPEVLNFYPVDDTTLLPGANLSLSFNEAMAKGTGSIRLVNDTTNTTTTLDVNSNEVSLSGNTLTLNPNADLTSGQAYHLEIDNGALTDSAGNAWAGIASASTWNFTASTPTIRLNTIASDNRINATENASTITLSGTVESNTVGVLANFAAGNFSVQLTPPSGGLGSPVTATVSSYNTSTGAWTATIAANTLVDGANYDVDVRVVGTGANTGLSAKTAGKLDVDLAAQAPFMNTIAGDGIISTSEAGSVITGNAETGATVSLSIGGNTRAATLTGSGWSYTLTSADITAMGQGAETIGVTQTDAAGNTSIATSQAVTVNTVTAQALPTPTINTVSSDNRINAAEASQPGSIAITGTNSSGATVQLNVGGNTRDATVSGTTWSYTLTAADISAMEQSGSATLSATQSDAAGNQSAAGTRVVTIDTLAPSPVRYLPSIGSTYLPDGILQLGFKEFILMGTGSLRILDRDNNNAVVTTIQADDYNQITITGMRLQIDPTADLIAGKRYSIEMDEGFVKDVTGNPSAGIGGANGLPLWDFTADLSSVTLNSITGDNRISATENSNPNGIVLNGTLSTNIANALRFIDKSYFTVTLTPQGGGELLNVTVTNFNTTTYTWTGVIPANTLVDGKTYDVKVDVLSPLLNSTSQVKASTTGTLVVALTTPAPTFDTIAGDDIINNSEMASTLTGTAAEGAKVSLNIGGNIRTAVVEGTTWRYALADSDYQSPRIGPAAMPLATPSTGLVQGTQTISITQKDASGNTSAEVTRSVTVDSSPPIVGLQLTNPLTKLDSMLNAGSPDNFAEITALGDSGAYAVAWEGRDASSNYNVYLQRFNTSGARSGPQVQLYTGDYSGKPQITALGSNGEHVVVWEGRSAPDTVDGSIYVQKFKADGTAAGARVQLDSGPGYLYELSHKVSAIGTDGAFVVTWHGEETDEGELAVFVQRFNADGTPTGSLVKLEAPENRNGSHVEPEVTALGSSGAFVVAWSGQDAGYDTSIFVQRFNADGAPSGDLVKLETARTTGDDTQAKIVAVGAEGAFVVAWTGPGTGTQVTTDILVQRFSADGTLLGSQIRLEGSEGRSDHSVRMTALGKQGDFAIAWTGSDAQWNPKVFVQKFNANGTAAGSKLMLSAADKPAGSNDSPEITAIGDDGSFAVAWTGQNSRGTYSIYVQRLDAQGDLTGDQVRLGVIEQYNGRARIDGLGNSGEFVVSWSGVNSPDMSIYTQKFFADGTTRYATSFTNAGAVPVSSNELGAAYLVKDSVSALKLSDITSAADNQWNKVDITQVNTKTLLSAAGLVDGTYKVYTADKAGNLSQAASDKVVVDSTGPTVKSIAIGSGSNPEKWMNAGDTAIVGVKMSEATFVTGAPQLTLNIGGTNVQATYYIGSGGTDLMFSYVIADGQNDANGISIVANSLNLAGGTMKDAVGNAATLTHAAVADNANYRVDTVTPEPGELAPTVISQNELVTVTASQGDKAYLVRSHFVVNSLVDFLDEDENDWREASLSGSSTSIAVEGLRAGVYKLYIGDNAGNLSAAAQHTVLVTNTTGDAINLGVNGLGGSSANQLILPVYVDGKWYMYFDKNNDGTANPTGLFGTPDSVDHNNNLDLLFKYASDFSTVKPGWTTGTSGVADTTETYRYATINGVKLALPNVGAAQTTGSKAGTAIDNSPTGENNLTYDDMLAIWDAFNGTGTNTGSNGTPTGWQGGKYLTASQTTANNNKHLMLELANGGVTDVGDTTNAYLALQVL